MSKETAYKLLTEADGKAWRCTDDIATKLDVRIAGIERRCTNIEERIKAVVEPRLADLSRQTGISCNPKQVFRELWRDSEASAGLMQSLKYLLHQLASCFVSVIIAAFRFLVFIGTLMAVILKYIAIVIAVATKSFDSKKLMRIYDHGTFINDSIVYAVLFT